MVDLIVIGAGPGGYEAALGAAQVGHSVTLIDKGTWGGVCLHEGCIPTKLYRHEVTKNPDTTFAELFAKKDKVVSTLANDVIQALDRAGVQRIVGTASFVDPHTVQVGDHTYQGQTILIATGSTPIIPRIEGIQHPRIFTSTSLLEQRVSFSTDLTVIGGGYIGMEWASILNDIKMTVKVVETTDHILGSFDGEISKRLQFFLKKRGIEFLCGTSVTRFESSGDLVRVHLSDGTEFETGAVLMAVGRRPLIDTLHLERAGVVFSTKGITVNADGQTSMPHIYAIGDCVGRLPLAHQATHEARHFLQRWSKKVPHTLNPLVPLVVFTHPECASIGLTSEAADLQGISYRVIKVPYRSNGKSVAMGETDGFVKVLVDADLHILGAHLIGSFATELIHLFTLIMNLGTPLSQLDNMILAHPTQSELLRSVIDASSSLPV